MGVFGSNPDQKLAFENSIAKRNEAEGITVFLRSEGGIKYSFLDDGSFPEKIQGYARIASIADYAYYIFPNGGKLSAADGELAVLLDSLGLKGSIEVIDAQASAYADIVKNTFKGVSISNFPDRGKKLKVIGPVSFAYPGQRHVAEEIHSDIHRQGVQCEGRGARRAWICPQWERLNP